MNNRIYFKGNPFPGGHAVKTFRWSGRLDAEQGLFFDFYLQTDDYNAEDKSSDAEEELPDWQSKIVWNNYHQCTIASKEKHQDGILIAPPFNFEGWQEHRLTADLLPLNEDYDPDDLAFGIYLLGHDTCANHHITISRLPGNLFNIHWKGSIALTYAGEEDFDHTFEAFLNNVAFDGIYYPQILTQEQARQLLDKMVVNANSFLFEDLNPKSFKREYKFVLPS